MLRYMSNAHQLRTLGQEPFGARLRRARQASGIELRAAAELISQLMFTSHTRLNRLEKMVDPPVDRDRRALAYLAMLVYGFDPAELGLTPADLPKGLRSNSDLEALLRSRCPSRTLAGRTQTIPVPIPA
jgi:transcriptional regulator with XRE-family HTH domain